MVFLDCFFRFFRSFIGRIRGFRLPIHKLITKAEQRYMEVGSILANHFVRTFQKAKHPIKGLLRQRDFFETQVKPILGGSKVAYVWVDALRFEMARELCRLLKDDFDLTIRPGLGTGVLLSSRNNNGLQHG